MNATIHLDLCAIFTPPHLKAYVPPQSDMIGHSLDKFDREVKKKISSLSKAFQFQRSLQISSVSVTSASFQRQVMDTLFLFQFSNDDLLSPGTKLLL